MTGQVSAPSPGQRHTPERGLSPEIPESPTPAAEHAPESLSQTVRMDETPAPDLRPGQEDLDIDILGSASVREVVASKDTARGGVKCLTIFAVWIPDDACNDGRGLQDLVWCFERQKARKERVSTLRDRKWKYAAIGV